MDIAVKKLMGFELPTFYRQLGLTAAFSVVTNDGAKNYFSCYADAADLVAEVLLHRGTPSANRNPSRTHQFLRSLERIETRVSEDKSLLGYQELKYVWWMIHTSSMYPNDFKQAEPRGYRFRPVHAS